MSEDSDVLRSGLNLPLPQNILSNAFDSLAGGHVKGTKYFVPALALERALLSLGVVDSMPQDTWTQPVGVPEQDHQSNIITSGLDISEKDVQEKVVRNGASLCFLQWQRQIY